MSNNNILNSNNEINYGLPTSDSSGAYFSLGVKVSSRNNDNISYCPEESILDNPLNIMNESADYESRFNDYEISDDVFQTTALYYMGFTFLQIYQKHMKYDINEDDPFENNLTRQLFYNKYDLIKYNTTIYDINSNN